MRGFTQSSLNRVFAQLMTLFSFLFVTLLVLWLGPVLIDGQWASFLVIWTIRDSEPRGHAGALSY